MIRQGIFAEIEAERGRQQQLGFTPDHDDRHSACAWIAIIVRHVGLAADDGKPEEVCLMDDHASGHDPARFYRQMIRAAAVCVAAAETFRRKVSEASSPLLPSGTGAAREPAWWQRLCDEFGQPLLILDRRYSVISQRGEGCIPYAVVEAEADRWERDHHVARYEPGGGRS